MPAKNILSARLGGELWYRRAQVLAFLSILAEVPTGIFTSVPTSPLVVLYEKQVGASSVG
jgi:hypothetical protein